MNKLNVSELELLIDFLDKQDAATYDQNDLGIFFVRLKIGPCGCAVRSAILALNIPLILGLDYYWELRYRLGLLVCEADYLFGNISGISAISKAYNLPDAGIYGPQQAIIRINQIMAGTFRGLTYEQE